MQRIKGFFAGQLHLCLKKGHTYLRVIIVQKTGRVGKGARATCPPGYEALVGTLYFAHPTCYFLSTRAVAPGCFC